jgi:hypothetical protein
MGGQLEIEGSRRGAYPAPDANGLNWLTEPVPGDGFLLLAPG